MFLQDQREPNMMMDTIENHRIEESLNDSNIFNSFVKNCKELISSLPEINKTRVEFLKEELACGRYQIINEQIAEKMFIDIEIA
jgi:anti-sigma28 factor (negative regulator of flagellin synthesis)